MSEKWGRRLYTTGAILLVLAGLAHSLSLLGKPVPANDTERQLMDLMSNYHFNVMGSMRSMDDFNRGFSIAFMLGMLTVGALDLVLRPERAALLKRVALVNSIWLALMTTVSLRYFFVAPLSFMLLGLILFGLAWTMLPAVTKN